MYKKIIAPVDLFHKDNIVRGVDVAVDLAKHYGATLVLVGVAGGPPGTPGNNIATYEEDLAAFAVEVGAKGGMNVHTKTIASPDPAVELEQRIAEAARELEADLVVMSSHKPGLMEYLIPSHAGHFASHSELSVFIVR